MEMNPREKLAYLEHVRNKKEEKLCILASNTIKYWLRCHISLNKLKNEDGKYEFTTETRDGRLFYYD